MADSAPADLDPKGPLPDSVTLPVPGYFEMTQQVEALAFEAGEGLTDFYAGTGPMLGAEALGRAITADDRLVRRALKLMRALEPDAYLRFLIRYYEEGLRRFGAAWGYADIVTVLLGLSRALRPSSYLEIGVRRGRSACAVASAAPNCAMVLMDVWVKGYAGMDNPGPDLVRAELRKVGHRGAAEFVDGDSHKTLPAYFAAHPDAAFDIITVDGDHANLGAAQDLADVLPRLKIGGAIVFDDTAHPKHPGLYDVWRRMVEEDRRFSTFNYVSAGFGVGFALRKH